MSSGVTATVGTSDGTITTSPFQAKWTQRSDAGGSYVDEEVTGIGKVTFGPMPASRVGPLLRARQQFLELQYARIRVTIADMQGYVMRSGY